MARFQTRDHRLPHRINLQHTQKLFSIVQINEQTSTFSCLSGQHSFNHHHSFSRSVISSSHLLLHTATPRYPGAKPTPQIKFIHFHYPSLSVSPLPAVEATGRLKLSITSSLSHTVLKSHPSHERWPWTLPTQITVSLCPFEGRKDVTLLSCWPITLFPIKADYKRLILEIITRINMSMAVTLKKSIFENIKR